MTRMSATMTLLAGLLTAAAALAAPPADAIFVQAESFATDGKSWVVKDQSDPYAPDSGLKHLWGPTGGAGTATTDVDVPAAGHYRVWVRYTAMAAGSTYNRGAFALAVKQAGATLAEGRFDEQPPETDLGYLHPYAWGQFEADLPAGKVTLELSKLAPIESSGWTRYVDCVLLTTDAGYTPDVRDFQPKMWLRVTLGPTPTPPIYIHCFADHFRGPWYMHFALSKDGYQEGVAPPRGKPAFLVAGEATPWCDITRAIHEDSGARLELRGAEEYSYTKWLPALDATFEFATAPRDDAIVKRFSRRGPGAGLVVITPGVLTADSAGQLKSDREFCDENVALVKSLPAVTFGKRPVRFASFLGMGMRPELFSPETRRAEYDIVARMGFNGTADPLDPLITSLGFRHTRTGPGSWFLDNDCYLQPQTERIQQAVAAAGKEWGNRPPPAVVMFMDEPCAQSLAHAVGCARCQEVFRAWLRDELRVPLADLQRASWEEVKPVAEADRDRSPALYYYSQRFRSKAFGDFLRLQTDEITKSYPGAPPATVNFSDGATYEANMYLMGADYFDLYGSKALSMAWSEDWSNIASSYQCCGYNVDLLRAGAKVHHQPLGMYVITSYGRTPLDVKLKAYGSLGRGVSVLYSYYYGPSYTNHEGSWYLKRDMYNPVTELNREIGGAEDLLVPARRVPSQVAFLYSTTSDMWTVGVTDLYGFDRMHSYLALLHAQVPVDFLSEQDVAAGRLKPYKALYVFGPNLLAAAAKPIADWTKAGGVLYLAGGAAVADEYNRAARPLDDLLALQRGDPQTQQAFLAAGRYLTQLKAQGQVTLDAAPAVSMNLFGPWQPITMPPSPRVTVQAHTADGVAMAARVTAGKGRVFVSAFAPGLSYVHAALLRREAQGKTAPDASNPVDFDTRGSFSNLKPQDLSYNPWEYPPAEREFLLTPVREAKVQKPVSLSQPLVETFYLEGPKGAVVTLANYALKPIGDLQVTIRCPRKVARVESVRRGKLAFKAQAGVVTTRLPLTDTDMIKLYW